MEQALKDAVSGVEKLHRHRRDQRHAGPRPASSSSGLSVKIYGPDADTITALGDKVVQMINDTEGFTNAATGLGQGDATINLDIDRDKVRAYGLTVAQVYQQIAAKLTTTTTAETPVTVDGSTMKVQISDNLDPVTKENMMDMTFTTSVMDATGTITTGTCTLGDIASWSTGTAPDSITSENQTRYITVTADTLDGYNTTVQSRVLRRSWTPSPSPMRCPRAAPSRWTASLHRQHDGR
ncbi:MAG: efflux RND transporter permease subunit [Faecalibacterium sp.]